MLTSIVTVTLSGTIEEKLDAAAAAGFGGVELFGDDLAERLGRPQRLAEVAAQARGLGLRLDLFQPFRDFEAVPAPLLRENLDRAERTFDDLGALGVTSLLVVSTTHQAAMDDDGLAADHLFQLAERASARGLRIVYEALAWGRYVHDYRRAWRIVQKADHPALGLCLDTFHIFAHGYETDSIRGIPAEKIFTVQLADAPPQGDEELIHWSRHRRRWPCDGSFPIEEFARTVLATGYRGTWSLEIFSDELRSADPHPAARAGLDSLRRLAAAVGAEIS